jgi:shikimate 5-dehydrogenase
MLDGLAFVKAQKDHGAEPEGARVLLVGAGGAGSAIAQDVMADFMLRHTDSPTG